MTLAIPKPTRADRPRRKVDTSTLAIPKVQFPRDAKYRVWIRQHECLLWWDEPCFGPVVAAHMQRDGRGIKGSDYSCVPLCDMRHHRLLDGNALDYEVLAFLWRRTWELLHQWMKQGSVSR